MHEQNTAAEGLNPLPSNSTVSSVWPPKTVTLTTGDGPDDTKYVITYDEMRRRKNARAKAVKAHKAARKARRRNRR